VAENTSGMAASEIIFFFPKTPQSEIPGHIVNGTIQADHK